MKIVSLLPSATEIVYALGLGDDLAAVTYECDYPPEAQEKPVVIETALPTDRPLSAGEIDAEVRAHMEQQAPIYKLDTDLIRQIDPDLILAQDICRVCAVPSGHVQEALASLGSTAQVISLDPPDLEGIMEGILEVGKATGTEERGAELVAGMRERIERVKAAGARLPRIRTLALEWMDPPFVGGHWIPQMVELASGITLLGEQGQPSRQVTWRAIADAQPEVLVHMPCGYYLEEAEAEAQRLYEVPELRETTAVQAEAVVAVDATAYFSRPGPRIVDGLEILAWCIHPEDYPQPPPDRAVRVPAP
ncbi:MAG TPA: ABC transporter substrate-binding protein [Actinomycetota bacterium]